MPRNDLTPRELEAINWFKKKLISRVKLQIGSDNDDSYYYAEPKRKRRKKGDDADKSETETSTELTPLEVALDHYGKKIADQLVTTDSEDSHDYVLIFYKLLHDLNCFIYTFKCQW